MAPKVAFGRGASVAALAHKSGGLR